MYAIWRLFKLSSIIVLATLASPGSSTAGEPVDKSSVRLVLAPGAGASPDERLRLAILSIHAYVEKHREGAPWATLLARVVPMQPVEAATNAGCVEAAVMSGRLAAHALSDAPALEDIVGYDHP